MAPSDHIHERSNGQAGQQGQQQGLAVAGLQYHGVYWNAGHGIASFKRIGYEAAYAWAVLLVWTYHQYRFQSSIAGKLHRVITQVRAAIHRIRG